MVNIYNLSLNWFKIGFDEFDSITNKTHNSIQSCWIGLDR